MRTRFPTPQADDGFVPAAYSDSALLSVDANNTDPVYAGPFLIYFGGAAAANIAIKTGYGTNITFKNVQPGSILPVAAIQLRTTGSTATISDLVCLVGHNGF
jgi:hypothetical protein